MLIPFVLILSTLLLFIGLALDATYLQWQSLRMQFAADAASIEGMYEIARFNGSWATAAQAQATMNGYSNGSSNTTVTATTPSTPAARATVSRTFHTFFMGVAGATTASIGSAAQAQSTPTCIWIRNPGGDSSYPLFVQSSLLSATCGVHVNTPSGYNVGVDLFAGMQVTERLRVVGPSSGSYLAGNLNLTSTKFGAAPKNDPLAYITAPTFVSCTPGLSNLSLNNVASYTASPGTYCGGITLKNSTLYLNAGLYIITGGLNMTNSTIHGESGVTIYFTQGGGSGYGTISASGPNTNVQAGYWPSGNYGIYLRAPTTTTSGGIVGICVWLDRNWVSHGTASISMSYMDLQSDGIWYLPNTGMTLWASFFTYYNYNGLVADNWYQWGSASLWQADYSTLGGWAPYHYEDGTLIQ